MKILFIILFLCTGFISAQTDCKLKKENLRPLIANNSPYFYRLSWDDKTKTETGKMDENTDIQIKQSGCDRHHMAFVLKFPAPDTSVQHPADYWPSRLFIWLDRVFENNRDWTLYRLDFRKQLLRFYSAETESGQTFNFPILERNFFYYETLSQGKKEIHLEIVRYLYNDRVKRPGVEEESYE